jgi:hypothetical protein
MEMTAEPVTQKHLATICQWWETRGDGSMPPGVLPPDGFVACDDKGPLVAGWLYRPIGCQVGIVDWLVSRTGETPGTIRPAARAVFQSLQALAEKEGITRLFASVASAGMLREAQACGFTIAALGNTHLVKLL